MRRELRCGVMVLVALASGSAAMARCPAGQTAPCVAQQAVRWQIGERLPIRTPWHEVRDWKRFSLPEPLEGSRYVRVDDDILRVGIANGIVLEALGVID